MMESAPKTYQFRLRFRIAKPLASSLSELELMNADLSRPVTLLARTIGQPMGEANWLVARSRGYPSESQARENGQILKDALLLSGAECEIGIDVGMDQVTSGWGEAPKRAYFNATGTELRNDIHGLDVFDDVEVDYVNMSLDLKVSAKPDNFLRSTMDLISLTPFMDERSRTSAQLINDALFPLTPETRLLVLMTAIESLWESPKRSDSISFLADALLLHLDSLEGSDSDKEDVRGEVEKIRTQRIGSLCRGKISQLLGPDRAKEFGKLYGVRSRFAHDGKGRALLHTEGDLAQRLAFDTLLAELRSRATG